MHRGSLSKNQLFLSLFSKMIVLLVYSLMPHLSSECRLLREGIGSAQPSTGSCWAYGNWWLWSGLPLPSFPSHPLHPFFLLPLKTVMDYNLQADKADPAWTEPSWFLWSCLSSLWWWNVPFAQPTENLHEANHKTNIVLGAKRCQWVLHNEKGMFIKRQFSVQ